MLSQPQTPTPLRQVPLVQAQNMLRERIQQGKGIELTIISQSPLESGYETNAVLAEEWHETNITVLRAMFSDGRVADEYCGPSKPSAAIARIASPTIHSRYESLARFVHDRADNLAKILDRLSLYPTFENAPITQSAISPPAATSQETSRPRVFIASSTEGLVMAKALKRSMPETIEVAVWNQGIFEPSNYTLEDLENALADFDFATFVFSPDDIRMVRGDVQHEVRDNVLFELGLFIGRLGRKRCFIMSPQSTDLRIPSDLRGITTTYYDASRCDDNLLAAVGNAAFDIETAIKKRHGQ
ncbi:MAG: nucleotide-binding protein [Thermomicrobia bacterium]|nr:nucleotide-binding protein [Thermomicrobia bacterium]